MTNKERNEQLDEMRLERIAAKPGQARMDDVTFLVGWVRRLLVEKQRLQLEIKYTAEIMDAITGNKQ